MRKSAPITCQSQGWIKVPYSRRKLTWIKILQILHVRKKGAVTGTCNISVRKNGILIIFFQISPFLTKKSLIWRDKKWKVDFFDTIKNSKKVLLFTPAHPRSLSIITPRYLYESQLFKATPFILMDKFGISCFLLSIINFDLSVLRVSLLEANQTKTFSNSMFTSLSIFIKSSFWVHKNISSANNFIKKLVASGKSFMKIRNNRGPRMDPYGTPYFILIKEDLTPLILTYCCLESR